MKTTSRSYERSVDLKVCCCFPLRCVSSPLPSKPQCLSPCCFAQVREAFSLDASEGTIAVACSEGIVRLFGSRTLTFKVCQPSLPVAFPRPEGHPPPTQFSRLISHGQLLTEITASLTLERASRGPSAQAALPCSQTLFRSASMSLGIGWL